MYKVICIALACSLLVAGQSASPLGTAPKVVVTVGHYYGPERPVLTRDDFVVTRGTETVPIARVVPLRGDRAGLELFFLVDNCSNCEPGSAFEDIRRFMLVQPATTAIGVAYILNGRLEVGLNPTTDHESAVRALNTPGGSIPSSPFKVLSHLIQSWPVSPSRRVVIMISNGINPAASGDMQDPSAEAAIDDAERAGVTVYTIYHPAADYRTSDLSKMYSGQVQLAHLANETGGEGYYLSFGPLPSVGPFLADISHHLANQYLIEFLALPSDPAGGLEAISIKCAASEELMAPYKVWIPAQVRGKLSVGAGGAR
jgi:hypothetical protein